MECDRDRNGLPRTDPGCDAVVEACLDWLARAQDYSASADGGVARDFSLLNGLGNFLSRNHGLHRPNAACRCEAAPQATCGSVRAACWIGWRRSNSRMGHPGRQDRCALEGAGDL